VILMRRCVSFQAWTALQIFNNGYVCTAYYQLPLFHGSPTSDMLEQLAQQPVLHWMAAGLRQKKVNSCLLSLVGGRYFQGGKSKVNIENHLILEQAHRPK
jgi:hypothetical protein